jgi:hypothetical protein
MTDDLDTLRPEARLLVAACRIEPTADDLAAIERLMTEQLDWGWLLEQAHIHRVICLLARHVLALDRRTPAGAQLSHRELLRGIYGANTVRNETLLRELGTLLREFAAAGIAVVVRKGPVLLQEIYRDIGSRPMNDLDLMVDPPDVALARQLLVDLGYLEGRPAANRRTVEPLPRLQQVFTRMNVPNYIYLRPASSLFLEWFVVDISLNQFLPGTPWSIPSAALGERSAPTHLFGAPARRPVAEEMLIDMATHLYKEATTLAYVQHRKDLNLSKFLDIAEWSRRGGVDWPDFLRRTDEYGVAEPVYYALHFADLLFPGAIPVGVRDRLRPADTTYLDEIGRYEGQLFRWPAELSFLNRLFDPDRARRTPKSQSPF